MSPVQGPEIQRLRRLLEAAQETYASDSTAQFVATALRTKTWPQASKAISLGLGSLTSAHQSRRMKQLALFIAITNEHSKIMETQMVLYAQDPTFTKVDEAFLKTLDIKILRTRDEASIGDAANLVDNMTLIYSPFLTLQAYKSLFQSCSVNYLIGDDFNALKSKWPKHTSERADVELIMRQNLSTLRRRAFNPGSFWSADEKPFPMAAYFVVPARASDVVPQGTG